MPYFVGGNGLVLKTEDPGKMFTDAFNKSRLTKLLGGAYSADAEHRGSALAALYGFDPEAGYEAQTRLEARDRGDRERFNSDAATAAALYRSNNNAYAQTAYSKLQGQAQRYLGGAQLPQEMDANVAGLLEQFAGSTKQPERGVVIGNRLVNPVTGKPMYEPPADAPKYNVREYGGKLYYIPEQPQQPQQRSNAPEPPRSPNDFSAYRDAVEWQESRGNPNAVSPKGARGPMQTMPGTLRDPGFGVQPARDNSPDELRRVGNDYLQAMFARYGIPGGLAAYNWGPGNWDNALSRSGGDPTRALTLAPQETQQYVPSVMSRAGGGMGGGGGGGSYVGGQDGLPSGAIPVPGLPDAPAQRREAPSGYEWSPDGSLRPIPGGPADRRNNPTAADQAKGEMGMRKELQDRIRLDRSVLGMYQNVQNAAKAGTAASDLSMIFAYMKMLDPNSVVREQEFANAQNAAGIPDRILNIRNQILSGNRLNPTQRQQFIAEARQLANEAQGRISAASREYQNIAEQYGYDPVRATGQADFRNVQSGPASNVEGNRGGAPAVGTEEGGYRYMGGDPANPASWRKL